ncbi:3'-5' exoribonuclease [Rhodanobacter sp. KK11]|jgi:hypothetical protein|uniref:3'-5' exoribonuclease n=1 Tax=Rhodanobacter sp. KK11 TaxID=3083255 RepID=UPI002966A605|nr:3'-5' exoribonuclease [Rhodanobacter sp. KK11]MDW2981747.1 3'-5' exoribonuclease [Rhodanobacter sp. KK11]
MIKLFLDCEWADPHADQLVSLALTSEDGQHRFYAEVSPLPNRPTAFVQAVVYPLLEHGWVSMRAHDLTESLRRFFAQHYDPVVIFDHPDDGKLLRRALQGSFTPTELPRYREALMAQESISPLIERYFRERPEVAKRRHHAGVDAEALRWAWSQLQIEGEGPDGEVADPV